MAIAPYIIPQRPDAYKASGTEKGTADFITGLLGGIVEHKKSKAEADARSAQIAGQMDLDSRKSINDALIALATKGEPGVASKAMKLLEGYLGQQGVFGDFTSPGESERKIKQEVLVNNKQYKDATIKEQKAYHKILNENADEIAGIRRLEQEDKRIKSAADDVTSFSSQLEKAKSSADRAQIKSELFAAQVRYANLVGWDVKTALDPGLWNLAISKLHPEWASTHEEVVAGSTMSKEQKKAYNDGISVGLTPQQAISSAEYLKAK